MFYAESLCSCVGLKSYVVLCGIALLVCWPKVVLDFTFVISFYKCVDNVTCASVNDMNTHLSNTTLSLIYERIR